MKGATEASFMSDMYSIFNCMSDRGFRYRLMHERFTMGNQSHSVAHLGQRKVFSAPLAVWLLPIFPRGGCGGSGEIPLSGAEVIHRQGFDNDPRQ